MQFNIKFTIKEAETARQPKLNPNVLNFEQINDDCLLHIASYLDLIDIVNFGKASRRLRSVSVQIYRKRTHFSFGPNTGDSSINEMNLAAILQEMGTFIQTIEWHHLQPIHLPYLSQYCHSVTELTLIIPSKDILSSSIKSVKRFFRNLKTLAIYGALFFDITMKAITSSSRLTSLKLSHCPNVQGKFLSTWKNSKLETLKICNSWKVDCEAVFNFEVEHKLAKFSFDAGCSFQQCLRLPPECLSNFTEIEIDFSYFTDNILELLNFEGLIELTSLTMTYKYVNSFEIFNNLLTAMSRIRKLKSLTIDQFRIDADTVNCLASFTNLRKIRLKEVNNTIGRRFYSSLPMHLPNIIELSMQMENSTEEIYSKSICDMITSLVHLKYFSHSSMTWQLLNTILQVRKSRKQTSIEIGVSKLLFNDPIKVCSCILHFTATLKKNILLRT